MVDSLIGVKLGQYEIQEKIGQGGMAQVFKAYQANLDRFVAIKVLSSALAENPMFSKRFQREALAVAQLNHPHILAIYDIGISDNYHYLVMRYIEQSRTLADLMQAKAAINLLIGYIIQIAEALNYAHTQQMVHRDIKPSNILIDNKWALLTDFGLVKIGDISSDLTHTGMSMGTPAYMSPEQAAGKHIDHRTDIYALGVILYQILTGNVPHHASTPLAIAIKRNTEPIPSLRTSNTMISPALEHLILKALEINPENRYDSIAQLADELQQIVKPPIQEVPQLATDLVDGPTVISHEVKKAISQPVNYQNQLTALIETLNLLTSQARAYERALPANNYHARAAVATLGELARQALNEAEDLVAATETPTSNLSPRELEVLTLVAQGLTNKEIAYRLNLSNRTIQFHLNSIFNKTNSSSRTEAVALALRQGWLKE